MYILLNSFQKPNSQLFYRRFCKENNLNIQWKTVRSKVKNMRYSFYRARDFESETNGVLDNDETKSRYFTLFLVTLPNKKCNFRYCVKKVQLLP